MKTLLLTAVATLGLTAATMAQNLPSYVPSNGLVGWWPFNGNANDESGNGNNAILQGNASFAIDRYSVANRSYLGDLTSGADITSLSNFPFGNSERTISLWFQSSIPYPGGDRTLFAYGDNNSGGRFGLYMDGTFIGVEHMNGARRCAYTPDGNWHNFTVTYPSSGMGTNDIMLYFDGLLQSSSNINPVSSLNTANSNIHWIGTLGFSPGWLYAFSGKIDDIGIWNRALTQQEITNLYNAINCANNTTISPQTNSLTIGSTATFVSSTSDPNPSYVWQSDLGQGFQKLNNFGNYSGVNTTTLKIANVQLSEHNQPIRVISTSGNCIDTSNAAVINILDTCITNVTVYDTLLTTVTDTLIINTTLSLPAPNNENTILIYPNPASDHITIYNGNFAAMIGYSIKITNNAGQEVFLNAINKAQFYVDLSTWSGNGLYFVHLIDPQNNTVTVKKIVLQ